MTILRAGNTINGKCCRAFATIDGKVEELFYIKSFNADITKNKTEVPVMGDLWVQHKAGSISGSGTMTMKYMSPVFRKMINKFATTHIDEYFNMMVVNDDPGSKAGIQSVTLNDTNIDGVVASKFDVESDSLEEDVSFTFSGVTNISEFNDPASYQ